MTLKGAHSFPSIAHLSTRFEALSEVVGPLQQPTRCNEPKLEESGTKPVKKPMEILPKP